MLQFSITSQEENQITKMQEKLEYLVNVCNLFIIQKAITMTFTIAPHCNYHLI